MRLTEERKYGRVSILSQSRYSVAIQSFRFTKRRDTNQMHGKWSRVCTSPQRMSTKPGLTRTHTTYGIQLHSCHATHARVKETRKVSRPGIIFIVHSDYHPGPLGLPGCARQSPYTLSIHCLDCLDSLSTTCIYQLLFHSSNPLTGRTGRLHIFQTLVPTYRAQVFI